MKAEQQEEKSDHPGLTQANRPPRNPVRFKQMELARLRAENARLRMERDILGKATAYFAKQAQ